MLMAIIIFHSNELCCVWRDLGREAHKLSLFVYKFATVPSSRFSRPVVASVVPPPFGTKHSLRLGCWYNVMAYGDSVLLASSIGAGSNSWTRQQFIESVPKTSVLLLLSFIFIVCCLAAYLERYRRMVRHINCIPGPATLPIIGNALLINADREGTINYRARPP